MAALLTRLIGAAAGGHQRVRDAGQPADLLRDALRHVGGGGERRAFRRADQDVVLRLIVLRQEVLADEHEERHDATGSRSTLSATTTPCDAPCDHASMRV